MKGYWTIETPTKPGLYWQLDRWGDVNIVKLEADPAGIKKELSIWILGWDYAESLEDEEGCLWWSEPVQPPPAKPEKEETE